MRDAFAAAGLKDQVDAKIWAHDKWWEVDVKAVGDGRAVLKYLAPYVYRVAISDKRIEACDEAGVTFRYTPSKSKVSKTRTLTGNQFVGGFLQHVLPSGLKKIRYYGWMSSNSQDPHRRSSLVGVVVFGLDVLAGQRPRTARATDRAPSRFVVRRVVDRCGSSTSSTKTAARWSNTAWPTWTADKVCPMNSKLTRPIDHQTVPARTAGERPRRWQPSDAKTDFSAANKTLIGAASSALGDRDAAGKHRFKTASPDRCHPLPLTKAKQNS